MPVTLAHPVAVLPLSRLGVPMSALVLGSMVPDLPLFLGVRHGYGFTHSWVGVVTVDLLAVVVGLAVWFGLVRDAVVDLSPSIIRSRFAAHGSLSVREWWWVPVGGAIGAASHVVWDAFTHLDGWGVARLSWLREEHLGLAGYQWAQHLSGVVGLAVVGIYLASGVARRPVLREQAAPRALGPWALPLVLGVTGAVGVVVALFRIPDGVHLMAYDSVVACMAAVVVLSILTAGLWRFSVARNEQVRG